MTTAVEHLNKSALAAGNTDWIAWLNDFLSKISLSTPTLLLTAGENLAARDPFYIKAADGKAWKAGDATECAGVWQSASTNAESTGFGQVGGVYTYASWTWTPMAPIYVNGGALSETAVGAFVGYAISATQILICPRVGAAPVTYSFGWVPTYPPSSPHASDDEFSDASLDGAWTEWDAGTILTVSEETYGLKLAASNASGVKYAGVSKALPSGDNLTIDAYMSIGGRLSNYVVAGLMVAEDIVTNPSTGKFSLISFQYGGADPFTIARALNYTNYTQNAAVWGTTLNRTVQSGMFLRIVKIGTAYYFLVSCDGIGYMVLHENQALGYTPTRVGLCINDEGNGGDCVAIARFIRFSTSTDLFRPVSGRRI